LHSSRAANTRGFARSRSPLGAIRFAAPESHARRVRSAARPRKAGEVAIIARLDVLNTLAG